MGEHRKGMGIGGQGGGSGGGMGRGGRGRREWRSSEGGGGGGLKGKEICFSGLLIALAAGVSPGSPVARGRKGVRGRI